MIFWENVCMRNLSLLRELVWLPAHWSVVDPMSGIDANGTNVRQDVSTTR